MINPAAAIRSTAAGTAAPGATATDGAVFALSMLSIGGDPAAAGAASGDPTTRQAAAAPGTTLPLPAQGTIPSAAMPGETAAADASGAATPAGDTAVDPALAWLPAVNIPVPAPLARPAAVEIVAPAATAPALPPRGGAVRADRLQGTIPAAAGTPTMPGDGVAAPSADPVAAAPDAPRPERQGSTTMPMAAVAAPADIAGTVPETAMPSPADPTVPPLPPVFRAAGSPAPIPQLLPTARAVNDDAGVIVPKGSGTPAIRTAGKNGEQGDPAARAARDATASRDVVAPASAASVTQPALAASPPTTVPLPTEGRAPRPIRENMRASASPTALTATLPPVVAPDDSVAPTAGIAPSVEPAGKTDDRADDTPPATAASGSPALRSPDVVRAKAVGRARDAATAVPIAAMPQPASPSIRKDDPATADVDVRPIDDDMAASDAAAIPAQPAVLPTVVPAVVPVPAVAPSPSAAVPAASPSIAAEIATVQQARQPTPTRTIDALPTQATVRPGAASSPDVAMQRDAQPTGKAAPMPAAAGGRGSVDPQVPPTRIVSNAAGTAALPANPAAAEGALKASVPDRQALRGNDVTADDAPAAVGMPAGQAPAGQVNAATTMPRDGQPVAAPVSGDAVARVGSPATAPAMPRPAAQQNNTPPSDTVTTVAAPARRVAAVARGPVPAEAPVSSSAAGTLPGPTNAPGAPARGARQAAPVAAVPGTNPSSPAPAVPAPGTAERPMAQQQATAAAVPPSAAPATPPAPASDAAAPAGPATVASPPPELRRPSFIREIGGSAPQAVALAAQVAPAPLPAAGITAPAAQVFGAAMHAAQAREEKPAEAIAPGQPAAMVQAATMPAAVADAGGQTLDMRQERWPHAMIDQIERLRDAADAGDTRIRLVPDALGAIDVSVRRDGDAVHVHFAAEQAATRTLLQDAQPRLAQAAEERGVRLGQTSVDAGTASSTSNSTGSTSGNPAGGQAGGQAGAGSQQPQQQARQTATPPRPAPARAPRDPASDTRDTADSGRLA